MTLSSTQKAAWAAVLSSVRGGRTLPPALQAALVDFFADNDLPVVDHWPVDVSDVDWQDVWTEYADGAGLKAQWQLGAVRRWVEDKVGSAAPTAHRAAAVVKLLQDGGVTLPSAMASRIEAALASGAAGDKLQQATCFEFVALLFCGQLLGVDEEGGGAFKAWWEAQKAAMQVGGTVRIRGFAGYSKLHSKSTVPTLERALLDSTGVKFELYEPHLLQLLAAHELPLAAQAFAEVTLFARQQFPLVAQRMRYLQHYFFVAYEGLGCPVAESIKSVFFVQRGDASSILVPTAPVEAAAYAQQMAGLAPWGGAASSSDALVPQMQQPAAQTQVIAETVAAVLAAMNLQAPQAGRPVGGAASAERGAGHACTRCVRGHRTPHPRSR